MSDTGKCGRVLSLNITRRWKILKMRGHLESLLCHKRGVRGAGGPIHGATPSL